MKMRKSFDFETEEGMFEIAREMCAFDILENHLSAMSEEAREKGKEKTLVDLFMEDFKDTKEQRQMRDLIIPTVEDSRNFFEKGKKIIEKDPIQASEKLYKTAENCIKILSQKYAQRQLEFAREHRSWKGLLDGISHKIDEALPGKNVENYWKTAFKLHVDGFHEGKMPPEEITKYYLGDIEELLKITEESENQN